MNNWYYSFLLLCSVCVQQVSASVPVFLRPENIMPHVNDRALWVQRMYAENPNVFEVDSLVKQEGISLDEEESEDVFEGVYRRWRQKVAPFVNDKGFISYPDDIAAAEILHRYKQVQASPGKHTGWQFAGPSLHVNAKYSATDSQIPVSSHANMYCLDQSLSNPLVLYCGGESGGIYKSVDKGLNWQYMSSSYLIATVRSIAIDPLQPDVVLAGSAGKIYKTSDGGLTWAPTGSAAFQALNLDVNQITYHPQNSQVVFAATTAGLYRSLNGGTTWTQVYPEECMSVIYKPGNPQVLYALRKNTVSGIADFYKSTDGGQTFSIRSNGWFTVPAADAGHINSRGGKIAVTQADTNKVYVLLVGESDASAQLQLHGFIGVYSSNNAGESFQLPHVQIGAPYDGTSHPNPMTFSGDNNTYNQIYYNTTIAVSQLNPNKILFGGLSLWKSDDGAVSFLPVGGYVGDIPNVHPDMQTIFSRLTSPTTEEFWLSCDGGINYSTDWMQTHQSRCRGIMGSDFWGFGQGWNEDIMTGGRYHNGNAAYATGFPSGEFLSLGGGEAATGYVNYAPGKNCLYSDIGGRRMPDSLSGVVGTFGITQSPNESYGFNSSSRVIFDYRWYRTAYMGKNNGFYKSTDGGSSFSLVSNVTPASNNTVLGIEQSPVNKNVFYAQAAAGSVSLLRRSVNNGLTWSNVPLPLTGYRNLWFCLSATSEQELWVGFTDGPNGSKVYKTTNGGSTWTNLTTATLNGFRIFGMCHSWGTQGGVYLAMQNGAVFYRNNGMTDWANYSQGLPAITNPIGIIPYYKGGKIRLCNSGIGIWEASLYEPSVLTADFAVDAPTFYCAGDSVHFTPHCVAGENATYQWSFPGATPSASNLRNPAVVYSLPGTFDATLIVSEGGVSDTVSINGIVSSQPASSWPFTNSFETSFVPSDWYLFDDGGNGLNWSYSDQAGGFGNSTHSMFFDNYYNDVQGLQDQVWTGKYDLSNNALALLTFDVAYAPYGGSYTDTLEIRGSNDCGQNYQSLYLLGGDDLATAPLYTAGLFVPTASQWRTDSVWIAAQGAETYQLMFVNRGHYGQGLYVDNIQLQSYSLVNAPHHENPDWNVFPNPASDYVQVNPYQPGSPYGWQLQDGMGRVLLQGKQSGTVSLDVSSLASGCYFLHLDTPLGHSTKKCVIRK